MIETMTLQAILDELAAFKPEKLLIMSRDKELHPARRWAAQRLLKAAGVLVLNADEAELRNEVLRKLVVGSDKKPLFEKFGWNGEVNSARCDQRGASPLSLRVDYTKEAERFTKSSVAEGAREANAVAAAVKKINAKLGGLVTASVGTVSLPEQSSALQVPAQWPLDLQALSDEDLDSLVALMAEQEKTLDRMTWCPSWLEKLIATIRGAQKDRRIVTIRLSQEGLFNDPHELYGLLGTYGGGLPLLSEATFIDLLSGEPMVRISVSMLWDDRGADAIRLFVRFATAERAHFYTRALQANPKTAELGLVIESGAETAKGLGLAENNGGSVWAWLDEILDAYDQVKAPGFGPFALFGSSRRAKMAAIADGMNRPVARSH